MPSMPREFTEFLSAHPAYARTQAIDELRASEFARLDVGRHVYLDYTGSGLYAESQVRRHADLLTSEVLGNPHSFNPTSALATDLVDRARNRVRSYFNASEDDYHVVFTANASQALKLVAESYPFEHGGRFLLTFDNHNSVNGIREFARARGASLTYVPVLPPDMRLDERALEAQMRTPVDGDANLFAYPAQSNFSGVQHPLTWIERAQDAGWDVLLDAAAFVPTNRLDLSRWHPDYVVLSFYKIFGYPTGVGALLASPRSLGKLRRPWFAGGTITVASVGADRYYLASGSPAFEDGTVNFLNLPALDLGFDLVERVGIQTIHERVRALCGWLIDSLVAMRHSTGRPMVRIYGPISQEARGGTVTLNFHDADGHFIDHQLIERGAAERRISIRGGCFCNPGAGEIALGLSAGEITQCFARSRDRMSYNEFRRCIDDKSSGAVRVSLGLASNYADVAAFLDFARTFLR
jgi:molybdenum cofactor sulfurtransferase